MVSRLRHSLENLEPERVFLGLACSFGLAVLFANPPFQAGDECDHFFRTFQLSEGTLIGEKLGNSAGGNLPQPVIDVTDTEGIQFRSDKKMTFGLFKRLLHPIFLDWSGIHRVYHGFPHTVIYSPAGYLPQTVAVLLGRHLGIGPLGLMYLARLLGFAASVALGFAALRVLPCYRWSILILLLCPMSLYLFGSIAPDGMLITGSALLFAYLLRLVLQTDRIPDIRDQAIVLALAGFLAVAKLVYLPLAGVALLLVLPKLGSRRSKALFCTATVLVCIVPVWLWARITAAVYVPGRVDIPIDPTAQAHRIIGDPIGFLQLVAHTIHVSYLTDFRWMIGTLGWGDTPMPDWFYPLFGLGILGCIVLEAGGAKGLALSERVVIVGGCLVSFLLIYAAQYASWNSPGAGAVIEGIQGRYFLPLAPLAILIFPRVPTNSLQPLSASLAVMLSALCAFICLWAVISRSYIASPALFETGKGARLIGISVRAMVGTGGNGLIGGFVVEGYGRETLLIRAEGPSLARNGISSILAKPILRVVDSNGQVLASNEGWGSNSNSTQISAASAAVGAPKFPANSSDSALILEVARGRYSVEINGADNSTGIAAAEIYEISYSETRLANISARSFVGTGDKIMLLSFVVGGDGVEKLLARADGPSLAPFGVDGVLTRPTISLDPYFGNRLINTVWGTSPNREAIIRAGAIVGAFQLPSDSADSAEVVTLSPGRYTLKVYGVAGATGVALAEIYELPH